WQFFRSAYRERLRRDDGSAAALAARWLAGDALTAAEAHVLGLRSGPAGLPPPDAADSILAVAALAQLARAARRPFVLAFGQLYPFGRAQVAALRRLMMELLDTARSLLLVTAEVRDQLIRMRDQGLISAACWDRIAQYKIEMGRLTPAEARQVLA